jgi:hypothetical protein
MPEHCAVPGDTENTRGRWNYAGVELFSCDRSLQTGFEPVSLPKTPTADFDDAQFHKT